MFATLFVLANACGGVASTASRGAPITDAAAAVVVDAQVCPFLASNYDRSCVVDTDCAVVTSTDYCSSQCLCGGSPIGAVGLAQFNADISKTPLGSGAIPPDNCGCPVFGRVCCLNGTCKIDQFACDEKDAHAQDTTDGESGALVVTNEDGGIFVCGSAITCEGRSQVCEHVQGGAPPGVDFYACIPIPVACDNEVSCACVTTALKGSGAGPCSAAGSNLTVQIDVP